MTKKILGTLLFMVLLSANPSPAAAQNQPPLSEFLPNLYFDTVVDHAVAFEEAFGSVLGDAWSEDQIVDQLTNQLTNVALTNAMIARQVASFPLGSSSGGFSWTYEPGAGTVSRATESFGPIFAERALTAGRNRLNFGVNYQRATFDQIEGKKLQNGEIKSYTGLMGLGDADLGIFFEDELALKVTTQTVSVFANYGLTDRLDVGIVAPISSVSMDVSLTSRVGATLTGVDPEQLVVQKRQASASGLGDMVLRAKYNFLKRSGGGLAGAVDMRLPTGDELNLLGSAGGQTRFYLIGSSAYNKVTPHFNIGYTVSGASAAAADESTFVFEPPDEVGYAGGVDFAATPRITLAGDILGRTLRDFGVLQDAPTQFGTSFREFQAQPGHLHQLLGSAGVKYNAWSNMLVVGNVLFPLRDRGMTDNLTWTLGFDYSF